MTQQDVINKVYEHYITNNQPPSWNYESKECRYRANLQPSGPRCAIGIFIPDEQYTPELESIIAYNIHTLPTLTDITERSVVNSFWLVLQFETHDRAAKQRASDSPRPFQEAIAECLKSFADKNSLVYPGDKHEDH